MWYHAEQNGTNFVGAQKELQKSLKEMCHHRIQNALLKEGVKWAFNPPFGAHFGGVGERLIKPVKKILHSVLKEQVLDDETLQTALCEVESIMNDRPLTTISSDPNDLEPLTSEHLCLLMIPLQVNVTNEERIMASLEIGRASCRERVSSPV